MAALRGKRVLAFAGIGDPGTVFQDAARQRDRCGAGARLSPITIRFRKARSTALIAEAKRDGADAGDDGKGSGAAAQRRGVAGWANEIVPFAVTLEFDDAARLRKFVTDRLFKARERNFASSS